MTTSDRPTELMGHLILDDHVEIGTITIEDGWIRSVDLGDSASDAASHSADGGELPYLAPGFVDVHVHGGGGHDAMDGASALDGMARHLLRHGVTSFLPTAVSAPLESLRRFADGVRAWLPDAPADGAGPLGFNLEGPFLADARRGAHDPAHLRSPADTDAADLDDVMDGLRLITIAPELPGALALITQLAERGVAVSLGHSAATIDEARTGYAAGATSATHLFNAMTGFDHRAPGLAVAALADDAAYVELIADGIHVHPALWPVITRLKPVDRLLLVSDAIAAAGTGDGRASLGGLEVEIVGQRVTLVGTSTLAGSVLTLDAAVRNLVVAGVPLPDAVAAATRNPLAMLNVTDRGRIAVGQRAELVELNDELHVRRVMRGGRFVATAG